MHSWLASVWLLELQPAEFLGVGQSNYAQAPGSSPGFRGESLAAIRRLAVSGPSSIRRAEDPQRHVAELGPNPARERSNQARTRMAPPNRFALPRLRQGTARFHLGRQRRRLRIDGLEASGDSGRDQGGTRTIDHAQVLPAARRVRGRDQHRSGVFSTYGKPLSGARLQGTSIAATAPRKLQHQVRARRGSDRGPDQSLQHDVRPVLHGCQSGRIRPRARLGRHQEDPR